MYKLWWLLSLNILQRFFRTTLFLLSLLFSWYTNEILKTDMLFPNTTLSELVKYRWPRNSPQYSFNKHLFFLFFCKAILSLVQILEGSRLLSSPISVIPLHHPLHTKMKCLNLTTFNYCSLWIIIVFNQTRELEIPSFCAQSFTCFTFGKHCSFSKFQ